MNQTGGSADSGILVKIGCQDTRGILREREKEREKERE